MSKKIYMSKKSGKPLFFFMTAHNAACRFGV